MQRIRRESKDINTVKDKNRLRTMLEEILSGRDSLNESENGDGKGFSKDLVKASWQVLRLSNYGKEGRTTEADRNT